jgi:hypothetical protein
MLGNITGYKRPVTFDSEPSSDKQVGPLDDVNQESEIGPLGCVSQERESVPNINKKAKYNHSYLDDLREKVTNIWLNCKTIEEFRAEYPGFRVTKDNVCDCIGMQWVRYYLKHKDYHPEAFSIHIPVGWIKINLVPLYIYKLFSENKDLFLKSSVKKQIEIIDTANIRVQNISDWNAFQLGIHELAQSRFSSLETSAEIESLQKS